MRKGYRQSIQIGKNVGDILNLPCVIGVWKTENRTLVYEINTAEKPMPYAAEKDWLCEDYNGGWHHVPAAEKIVINN